MASSTVFKSLVLTLTCVTFVGCKTDSKSNPIKANRSKVTNPQQSPQNKPQPQGQSVPNSPQVGTSAPPQDTQASKPDATSDKPDSNQQQEVCKSYVTKLNESGWEQKHNSQVSAGFRYFAFTAKNSQLKNPVLVLLNNRKEIDQETSDKILELGKKYLFDPILLDIRSSSCGNAFGKEPLNASVIQASTSREIAKQLEAIRKQLLKDQAWKVWANGSASLIALRLAETAPQTIKGLYLADFALTLRFDELVEARLLTQIEVWNEFVKFAKEKNLELNDEKITKIRETLKKHTCSQKHLCGEVALNTYLMNSLSGSDEKWQNAVSVIKELSEGKLPSALDSMTTDEANERFRHEMLIQIADRQGDLRGSACMRAQEKAEVKEKIKNSLLNSCLWEKAILEHFAKIGISSLNSDIINLTHVHKNLEAAKAQYFVSMSKRSLMNPIRLLEKHREILKDVMVDDFDTGIGQETFLNEGLLEKMQ